MLHILPIRRRNYNKQAVKPAAAYPGSSRDSLILQSVTVLLSDICQAGAFKGRPYRYKNNAGIFEYEIRTQELKVQQAQNTYGSSGAENDRLQLEIEKNTLAQLQNEYDTSKLYAPCDDLVSFMERMNPPSSSVQACKVIATIIDPDKIYVKAAVNDDKI